MTEGLDLRGRLAQFIDRKATLARKQLAESGKTSELPISFSTLRTLVLTHEDWRGVRPQEMIDLITQVASLAQLVLIDDYGEAWDLPEDTKSALKTQLRNGVERKNDPTYKPPKVIVVKNSSEMPSPRRDRHTGADGDWSGEQTYNIDDM